MKTKRQHIRIEHPLCFQTNADEIGLVAVGISLFLAGDAVTEVRIDARADLDTLRQIEEHGHFHNTPDVRLPAAAEEFDPALPVFMELRLEPKLVAHFPPSPAAAANILRNAANAPSAVFEAASWYVLNVKQSRGIVMTGYATTWFVPKTPIR